MKTSLFLIASFHLSYALDMVEGVDEQARPRKNADKHSKATKLFKEKAKSEKSKSAKSSNKGSIITGHEIADTKAGKDTEYATKKKHVAVADSGSKNNGMKTKASKAASSLSSTSAKTGKHSESAVPNVAASTKSDKATSSKDGKSGKGPSPKSGKSYDSSSVVTTATKGEKEEQTTTVETTQSNLGTKELPVEELAKMSHDEEEEEEEIPLIDPALYTDLTLREAVELLIEHSERELIPKFLRLGFHDCVGGCNGCVDLSNPDNKGLLEPIEHLASLVDTFKDRYSRADVWAMATLVAADKSLVVLDDNGTLVDERPEGLDALHFPMTHIGRTDCVGADEKGIGGPDVEMPSNDLTTHELLQFFDDEFNFTTEEAVAIMGAHSVAVATRENVGFGNLGKEEGWVCHAEEYILDNRYYSMLVGDEGDEVNGATLLTQSSKGFDSGPNWELELVDNTLLDGDIPNRYQWFNEDECNDERPIMTNADMALVRDFTYHISVDENGTTGKVNCTFKNVTGKKACPVASTTIEKVLEYKRDKMLFIEEFEVVLGKMVNNGYSEDELLRV